MVYIYEDDRGILHNLNQKLKHSVKTYIGAAETRTEAKHLLEEYYGEDKGNRREALMWFLDAAFPEKGIFQIEVKYRHVEILHDDDEYWVRTISKGPFRECRHFTNLDEAMEYAWNIEKAVEDTAEKTADLCLESLEKFKEQYGKAAAKSLLPEIEDLCFGELADRLNINYRT